VRRYEKRALVQEVYNGLDQRSKAYCNRSASELEAAIVRACGHVKGIRGVGSS
jgi:hypothetical protein